MARQKFSYEEALEQLDLDSWLAEHVELKDGGGDERRIQTCPKCGDDRHKLYVNVEKKQFTCYKCDWGRGASIIELMAEVSGRHETLIRIELATMVIPAPVGDFATLLEAACAVETDEELQPPVEQDVPGNLGFGGISTKPVQLYALGRGMTQDMLDQLSLRSALRVPTKRGNEVAGPWLVFPVRLAGKNVAWQGRRVNYDGDIKYLSSQGIHDWLWPLEDMFFRVYRPGMPVVIVEGVFDALGLLRYGVAALCTFGKSISEKQVRILEEIRPVEVILMWDADAWKEITRAADKLMVAFPKVSVVDTSAPGKKKIDAGDALKDKEVVPWLATKIRNRMDARSQEFYQLRLDRCA